MSVTIPSSGELVSNMAATIIGDSASNIASIEKNAKAFTNEKGFYQEYPAGSLVTYEPYKALNNVATAVTVVSTGLDVANTWTADSGNTNMQRLQKTAIQGAGVVVSIKAGMYVGALLAPVTGGASLVVAVGVSVVVGMAISYTIEASQNELYNMLDIK